MYVPTKSPRLLLPLEYVAGLRGPWKKGRRGEYARGILKRVILTVLIEPDDRSLIVDVVRNRIGGAGTANSVAVSPESRKGPLTPLIVHLLECRIGC